MRFRGYKLLRTEKIVKVYTQEILYRFFTIQIPLQCFQLNRTEQRKIFIDKKYILFQKIPTEKMNLQNSEYYTNAALNND